MVKSTPSWCLSAVLCFVAAGVGLTACDTFRDADGVPFLEGDGGDGGGPDSNHAELQLFFVEDFESGSLSTDPQPAWSWPEAIGEGNVIGPPVPMMLAQGDLYETSETVARGTYSLRLRLDGRNGWCNTCGSAKVTASSSMVETGCIPATAFKEKPMPNPAADVVFDVTDGFSTWPVVSVDAEQVCFDPSENVGAPMFGEPLVAVGDELRVPYQCGVNGDIAGDEDRRAECDVATNYLSGVSPADLPLGASIARRFYVYIPRGTVLPDTALNLATARFRRQAGASPDLDFVTLVGETRALNIQMPGEDTAVSYALSYDRWYYFEEVWTRESTDGGSDGHYALWVSPEDEYTPNPLVDQSGVVIGELVGISLNGLLVHTNDAHGFVYFDDFVIANGYIGPE